jgi:hypothetical protein
MSDAPLGISMVALRAPREAAMLSPGGEMNAVPTAY